MRQRALEPFGVELGDVDLSADLSSALVDSIVGFLDEDGLVLFRGQSLTPDQQVAFAAHFGSFSQYYPDDREGGLVREYNNRKGTGQGEAEWHSDLGWTAHPLKYLVLYGVNLNNGAGLTGGATLFASASRALLDRLPHALLDELRSLRCRNRSYRRPDETVIRPCIETHPRSAQPYVSASRTLTTELVGVDRERTEQLLTELFDVMYDEEFVYRHAWCEGDLVIFDNLLLQHKREDFDDQQLRVVRRCAIASDTEPTAIAAPVA